MLLLLARPSFPQPTPAAVPAGNPAPAPTGAVVTPVPPATMAPVAPDEGDLDRRYSLGATLSNSIATEDNSTSWVSSPLLEGAYAVHRRILVSLALGFGWLVDNQGLGESTFRAGNPQLSGHYHAPYGSWNFDIELGVTAPLAHVPLGLDGRLYAQLYNRTLAMGGMWNQWLWLTDHMAVPAMLRASYTLPHGEVLVLEVAEAMVIGVRGSNQTPYFLRFRESGISLGPDMLNQVALEARIPIGPRFVLVPRVQTVQLPRASIDGRQSAAALRGILVTKHGRFFLGVLVNLDEPIAAQGGIERWGFHLGKEIDL